MPPGIAATSAAASNAAATAASRPSCLQHRGKHHRLVRGRLQNLSTSCIQHIGVHELTISNLSFCRDVSTGTQLVQYKTNSSGRNRFCKLGHDYFVAAQNGKDSVHFWTWHKVRC